MGSPNLSHMNKTYLLTSPQSRLIRHPVLPSTFLPATFLSSPLPGDIHCQVCQSPFDEHKMLLCDICNAGWHTDCPLPPFTTIPTGTWKCPLNTLRHLLPQTATRHLCLPSPILDFGSDWKLKNHLLSLNRAPGLPNTIQKEKIYIYTSKHSLPHSGPIPPCTPITMGQGLKPKSSTWFAMGGLGFFTQTVFFVGFFFRIFFSMGIGPCGPVPSPPLEWTSCPPLVTAVLIIPKGAESPGSRRIGVIGALVHFLPSKTV